MAHGFKSVCSELWVSSESSYYSYRHELMLFLHGSSNHCHKFAQQAKESWEMDTKEKLEQAAIVKEKGTVYFKVCESSYS